MTLAAETVHPPSRKVRLRGLVAFLTTGGCFLILFGRIEWRGVWAVAKQVSWLILPVSIALSLAGTCWLNVVRWRLFLKSLGWPLSASLSRTAKLGGFPFKALLPFQGGEALRIIFCQRQAAIPPIATTASILLEYAWTLGAFCAVILVGGIVSGLDPRGITGTALVVLLAGGCVGLLFRIPAVRRIGRKAVRHISGAGEQVGPEAPLHPPWGAIRTLAIAALSVTIVGLKLVNFAIIFAGLGVRLSVTSVMVFASAIYVIGFIPVSVLGLGTREAATVVILSGVAPASTLLAGAMLVSAIEFLLPLLVSAWWTRRFVDGLSAAEPRARAVGPVAVSGEM